MSSMKMTSLALLILKGYCTDISNCCPNGSWDIKKMRESVDIQVMDCNTGIIL